LAGEFGYQDTVELPGMFEDDDPFPVRLELDGLT
jgi:hypothetical protein